ncbi:hypothetical protein SUDANB58_02054 [Streptomyces sp. enrichment culture]|uniref:hypothetical protein n=1 Tax=Streptomyces sp. enrichment culture TaxID=1795815 RepID=UPI003F568930
MGSLSATLCAGAALAALLAPASYAADGGRVSVSPATPAPGTDVTLRVAGCTGGTAVAVSTAFVSDVRLALVGTDGILVGAGRVRSTATAGVHEVKVGCGAARRTDTLTVAGRTPPSAVPASPVAPVAAGGGGSARLTTAADDDGRTAGPGAAHTVTGLLLTGAAAVAVALRGARRRPGTE